MLGASGCPNVTTTTIVKVTTTVGSGETPTVTTASTSQPEVPQPPPTVTPASGPPPYWTTQRIAGVSVGGAGLAGVVVGAIFGIGAIVKTNGSNCTDANVCQTPDDAARRRDGQTWGTVSSATFIPGCILLAAGVVTFVVPSTRAPAALQGVGLKVLPGGLAIQGDL